MSDHIKKLDQTYIMPTYKRADIVFDRGEGCYLYDSEGKKYLDFLGGIATCTIGHANREVASAVAGQLNKLVSVSNLYYSAPQALLAEKLAKLSGLKKTFFCHSGTEANEAAIKLAKKITGKKHFIAFYDSFHGRTTASLALTWKKQFKEPFLPLAPRVTFVRYGDIQELKEAIEEDTAGVIIEPIQGESGVIVPPPGFLTQVRQLCNEKNIMMIADEVQTGMGRTGKFFAYQHEGIKPDIVTLAKGLANGLPIGVCLSDYELSAGEHGSTLGGNSISAVAALATIDYVEKHDLASSAGKTGDYLMDKLEQMKKEYDIISSIRGKGLMIGVVLSRNKAKEITDQCMDKGLIINAPTENILRFLPPLIIGKKEADQSLAILEEVINGE